MQTPWQREGENVRCLRHSVVFGTTESCSQCDDDPGKPLALEAEPLPAPPDGCQSSLDIERELGAELTAIRRQARALVDRRRGQKKTKKKTKREAPVSLEAAGTAAKLWDTYLKGARLLISLANRREDAEIVRRYQQREAARTSGVAH